MRKNALKWNTLYRLVTRHGLPLKVRNINGIEGVVERAIGDKRYLLKSEYELIIEDKRRVWEVIQ